MHAPVQSSQKDYHNLCLKSCWKWTCSSNRRKCWLWVSDVSMSSLCYSHYSIMSTWVERQKGLNGYCFKSLHRSVCLLMNCYKLSEELWLCVHVIDEERFMTVAKHWNQPRRSDQNWSKSPWGDWLLLGGNTHDFEKLRCAIASSASV